MAIIGAFFAMYYEASGGYLMLMEFNKEAQAASEQFEAESVLKRARDLRIDSAFITPMADQVAQAIEEQHGRSAIAAVLESAEPWRKFDADWRSNSRKFYLATVWYMIFAMLLGFSLIPVRRKGADEGKRNSLLSLNLSAALVVFLMWMPFRIYYNHHTKIPLFGPDLKDNYLQVLMPFNVGGLTSSDIAPLLAISVFVFFLLLRAADLKRRASILVVATASLVIIASSVALAVFHPPLFAAVFGLDGNVKFLVSRIVVVSLLLLLTYDFVLSRVNDEA